MHTNAQQRDCDLTHIQQWQKDRGRICGNQWAADTNTPLLAQQRGARQRHRNKESKG